MLIKHFSKRNKEFQFLYYISFLAAIFLLLLSIQFSKETDYREQNNRQLINLQENQPLNLKSSNYWTNFSYIHIYEDNWTNAVEYGWCTGSGTWDDPYVIENIAINVSDINYGILIENCSKPFIIKNCTIYNSKSLFENIGIFLENANNGSLINNNCSRNNIGIFLYNSQNITISLNNITINYYGIIIDNNSDNNTIYENKIFYNTYCGMNITTIECNYNLIFKNNFTSNGLNANDNGTNNFWNSSLIGNYWSNYGVIGGVDLNDNGIGDTPFNITGDGKAKDYLPIWEDGDNTKPTISSAGGDNIWRSSSGTFYDVNFSDPNPSSGLDFAEYKITNNTKQGGIILKNWTKIFTNLGTFNYTTDWTIDFGACQEGYNYISVRVYDKAGNFAVLNDSFYIKKDIMDPVAPIALTSSPATWTSVDSFSLSWTNPSDTSSIVGARYLLDLAPSSDNDGTLMSDNDIESISGIILGADGVHTVYLWLMDNASNINFNNYAMTSLYLDSVDPAAPISLIVTPSSWTSINSFSLSWTNPSDTSGIVGARYLLDSAPMSDNDGMLISGNDIESISGIILGADGVHTVYVWLVDNASNINFNNYAMTSLYLDSVDPAAPISLIATPSSWTSVNSFSLSWTNPSDTSGIVGARYLLDSAPMSDNDGMLISGNDIESISGIILGADGVHTVYVWLVDNASNIHFNNYDITSLYLDTINPTGSIKINNDVLWTQYLDVTLSLIYIDDTSGVLEVRYRNNGDAWGEWETPNPTKMWSLSEGDGTKTIYYEIKDNAGLTSIFFDTIGLDTSAPNLVINSPENETYWKEPPSINITVFEPNIASFYYVIGSITKPLTYNASNILDPSIWDSLSNEQQFTIYIYAWDTFNHLNDTYSLRLYKDIQKPTIIINSPVNNTYWKEQTPINITIFDLKLNSSWYRIYSETTGWSNNISLSNNTKELLNFLIWNNLAQGEFKIYFYANDSVNNLNNDKILKLYKDTIAPYIQINSPNNSTYQNSPPLIKVTVFDQKLDKILYRVHSISNDYWSGYIPLINATGQTLDELIWNNLPLEGLFQIYIYTNDSAGNINETIVLTLYKDIRAPRIISIDDPDQNGIFGSEAPYFNILIEETYLNTTWYILTNATNPSHSTGIYKFYGESGNIDQTAWNFFGNGSIIIKFYANDTLGNQTVREIIVYKDIYAPLINIYSPENNTLYGIVPPNFTLQIDGPVNTIWYCLYNNSQWSDNYTISIELGQIEGTINQTAWYYCGNGTVIIRFYINDTVGNIRFKDVKIYKDIVKPFIKINSPNNNGWYGDLPTLNIDYFDPNNDTLWYRVYSETTGWSNIIILSNNTDQLLNSSIWNNLGQGIFQIYIYANDTVGNLNITYITLYKDTLGPIFIINTPKDDSYWNTAPRINVTVYEPKLLGVVWYLVSGYSPEILGNHNETKFLANNIWYGLGQGKFEILIYGNDEFLNYNEIIITLYKDTLPPEITINLPLPGDQVWNVEPTLNITYYDPNNDTLWYSVYQLGWWSSNIIMVNNSIHLLNQNIWENYLNDGEFQIYIYANDTFGYENDFILNLMKDTKPPKVTINLSINESSWNTPPPLSISAIDLNFDSIWYRVYSSYGWSSIITTKNQNFNQLLDSQIWNALPDDGPFQIFIYANDTVGNTNSTFVLTLYKDVIAPDVTINSPGPYKVFGNNTIPFDISINDPSFNTTWYRLWNDNSWSENFTIEEIPGTIDENAWNNCVNGTIIVEFFANDSLGNIGSKKVQFFKDMIPPDITILYPISDQLFGKYAPEFNLLIIESNLNKSWYILINDTNQSDFSNIIYFTGTGTSISQEEWVRFENGVIKIRFYINDTVGNLKIVEIRVGKDIEAPSIFVETPQQTQVFGINAPAFRISTSGTNINTTWYILSNISFFTEKYIFKSEIGTINQSAWNYFRNGDVIIWFYINDSLNNRFWVQIYIYKDTIIPNIITNSPENGKLCNKPPIININAYDIRLSKIWYKVYSSSGGWSSSIQLPDNYNQLLDANIWNNLGQESFQIYIYANDTVGNINYYILTLYKDTISPDITIISPKDGYLILIDSPLYEIEILNIDLDSCWYTINGGILNISIEDEPEEGRIFGKINQTLWGNYYSNNIIVIRFYANDTAGNIGYAEVTLYKSSPVILTDEDDDSDKETKSSASKDIKIAPIGMILTGIAGGIMIPVSIAVRKSRFYRSCRKQDQKGINRILVIVVILISMLFLGFAFTI